MFKKILVPAALSLLIICGVVFAPKAYAATGVIYLSPSATSVQANGTLVLSLRINPGTTVNGVQATVNFDTNKLQFVSVDTSASPFNAKLQQSQSGGTLTIARGNLDAGVSSDSIIASISLKATSSTGSTSVTITNANATAVDASYTNPAVQNATVATTVQTCPSGQTGTPPNCVSPVAAPAPSQTQNQSPSSAPPSKPTSGTNKPAAPAVTAIPPGTTPTPAQVTTVPPAAAPKITNVNAISQYTLVSLSVNTDVPTTAYIKYGLDSSLKLSTPPSELATSHIISLDPKVLTPGETYYYSVVARTANGGVKETEIKSLHTLGLTLKIKVLDKDQKPLRNKTVVLHSVSYTAKTDSSGVATIVNATPGQHHLEYKEGKKTYSQVIQAVNNITTIGTNQASPVQNFSVVYAVKTAPSVIPAVAFTVLILACVAVAAYLLRQRLVARAVTTAATTMPTSTLINSSVIPAEPSLVTPAIPSVTTTQIDNSQQPIVFHPNDPGLQQ